MATGHLIVTPTDFGAALDASGDYVRSNLVTIAPEFEPTFRHALDAIFADLPYVSAEDGTLPAYLDGVEEPLRVLREVGVSLFAVVTQGTMNFPESPNPKKRVRWSRTYYLTVPTDGRFRVGDGSVHRFAPPEGQSLPCAVAVQTLADAISKEVPVNVFLHAEAARITLERNVPWCPDCCLGDSLA